MASNNESNGRSGTENNEKILYATALPDAAGSTTFSGTIAAPINGNVAQPPPAYVQNYGPQQHYTPQQVRTFFVTDSYYQSPLDILQHAHSDDITPQE